MASVKSDGDKIRLEQLVGNVSRCIDELKEPLPILEYANEMKPRFEEQMRKLKYENKKLKDSLNESTRQGNFQQKTPKFKINQLLK